MAQAREVAARLAGAHGWDDGSVEIVTYRTTGDALDDRPLAEFGGKGLFTKEIEAALLDGQIDIAVHSAKDLQTDLPPGLAICATLPREDVRDAFLSPVATILSDLPRGAVLGTSSLRRKALALMLRPDLKVVDFRGNVATRLRKLEEGVADATMLALAGLKRLGLADRATSVIELGDFLPAVGQGAIAIEARLSDEPIRELLAPVSDPATFVCIEAERAFLAALDGSCRTPIGGLAQIDGDVLGFRGIIVTTDGRAFHRIERSGTVSDASAIGRDAGEELVRRGGPDFFGEA
jgi:hydroxymethylbilane synthase